MSPLHGVTPEDLAQQVMRMSRTLLRNRRDFVACIRIATRFCACVVKWQMNCSNYRNWTIATWCFILDSHHTKLQHGVEAMRHVLGYVEREQW